MVGEAAWAALFLALLIALVIGLAIYAAYLYFRGRRKNLNRRCATVDGYMYDLRRMKWIAKWQEYERILQMMRNIYGRFA